MGRRPNPIIVKNFNRGSKLTDHSNRYAHTCKHCGSNFPKGRVDNLITHAVKFCPSINPQARVEALGDYAQQAGTNDAVNNHATFAPTMSAVAGQQQQIPGHGLDALAYAALNDGQAHGQSQVQAQTHYALDHAMMVGGNGDDYGGQDQDQDEQVEVEVSAAKRPKLKMATAYTMTTPPPRLDIPRGRGRRGPGSRGGRRSRALARSHGQPPSPFDGSGSYTESQQPTYAASGHIFDLQPDFSLSQSHSYHSDSQRRESYPNPDQEKYDPPSPNIDPSLQQLEPSIENAAFGVPSDGYYEQDQAQDHFGGREGGLELPDSNFSQIATLRSPDREHSYHVPDHTNGPMTGYVGEELNADDHYVFGPRPQRAPAYQPHEPAPFEQPFANSGPASFAPRQSISAAPSPFGADVDSAERENGKRNHKQRLRGKFNDTRKREVQAVRKLGACLRCRMLKKPCSQGDPCEACEKIEDPRLWHFECTRTRLETAFNHFSSGIHSTSAYANEITPLRNESPFDSAKTIIDATQAIDLPIFLSIQSNHGWPLPRGEREDLNLGSLLPSIESNVEASHFVSLAGNSHIVDLADRTALAAGVISDVAATHAVNHGAFPISLVSSKAQEEIFVLNHESNDIPIMIRVYVQEMLPHFVANEPSDFMRVVLDIAQTKAAQFDHDHPEFESAATPKKGQPDDKYNIVKLSLEMWAVVKVLLETDLTWSLSKRTADEEIGSGRIILPHEESYHLIVLQLKAAAETKAADLVKQVVGIVERQLLKATSKTHFDLFIVGLLILNTLEKATWLFEKFNRPTYVVAFPLQGDDEGPNAFLDARLSIVKLMNILLRMRGVPPPTYEDSDGILTTRHDDESRAFYDRIHLSHAYVLKRFQMDLLNEFVMDNSRSYELNLCSWLLLPAEDLPKEAVPKKIAATKKESKPRKHSY